MNLNNRGFAITGILYTLFILFLLILVGVLAGLSNYRTLGAESIVSLEDSFSGIKIDGEEFNSIKSSEVAEYFGRYKFKVDGEDNVYCFAYLEKGTSFSSDNINSITFSPNDCNDYKSLLTLYEVYSFEE